MGHRARETAFLESFAYAHCFPGPSRFPTVALKADGHPTGSLQSPTLSQPQEHSSEDFCPQSRQLS